MKASYMQELPVERNIKTLIKKEFKASGLIEYN